MAGLPVIAQDFEGSISFSQGNHPEIGFNGRNPNSVNEFR